MCELCEIKYKVAHQIHKSEKDLVAMQRAIHDGDLEIAARLKKKVVKAHKKVVSLTEKHAHKVNELDATRH